MLKELRLKFFSAMCVLLYVGISALPSTLYGAEPSPNFFPGSYGTFPEKFPVGPTNSTQLFSNSFDPLQPSYGFPTTYPFSAFPSVPLQQSYSLRGDPSTNPFSVKSNITIGPKYRLPYETIPWGTDIEVLVLGPTGSGKTTFLNTAANYFLSGSFGMRQQDQRVQAIVPTRYLKATVQGFSHSEYNVKNQGKSQTSKPKAYPFEVSGRYVTFVDTPGMGDTAGITKDEEHLKKILNNASEREKLSGIILFFNGAEPRETATKVYAFNKLVGLIPDLALKNMIVVLTNTHKESSSFPIQSILDLGVSPDRIFYMNNSVLASDPESWKDERVAARLTQDWEDSMITVGNICEKLSASPGTIGQEFKRMRELRNAVMGEFHKVRLKFTEIQKTQNAIELFKTQFHSESAVADDFKDFAKKATIKTRKFVKDPNRYYSTVCTVHHTTCHDKCSLNETHQVGDQVFTGCLAFNGSKNGARCKKCSSKESCSFAHHYHARGVFEEVEETLQDRLEEYKRRHNEATNAAQSAQEGIGSAQAALEQIKKTIDQFATEVEQKLEELKSICKGYNFVAELNTTIQLLKQEASSYTSIEARNTADGFIAALEMMAERLTEQGFDKDDSSTNQSKEEEEEPTNLKSKTKVFSYVRAGIGNFGKLIDKRGDYSKK